MQQELAASAGRALEPQTEHLIPPLARRAGEVSTAGRDTFLATMADQTLSAIVENLSETRVSDINHILLHRTSHHRLSADTGASPQICLQNAAGHLGVMSAFWTMMCTCFKKAFGRGSPFQCHHCNLSRLVTHCNLSKFLRRAPKVHNSI